MAPQIQSMLMRMKFVFMSFPPECLSEKNADGQTPLHLFLDSHPWEPWDPDETDEREDLVWQLLENQPELTNIADKNGNLPLHLAVGLDSAGIFGALLRCYPQSLHVKNKAGHSPFDLLWSCEYKFWRKAIFCWRLLYTGHVGLCIDLNDSCDEDCDDFSILHAAASTPCPPSVMRQLLVKQDASKLHRNFLPVTLAARTPIHRPISQKTEALPTVLQLLVEATPRHLLFPIVLTIALQNGKEWHEGVSCLVQKIPGALCRSNNGLWPPMTAALGGCSLTTVYKLLRTDPSICKTAR